jgi:hypothetical protein
MSSKKASNYPRLCPIKGQKSGLCSLTRDRNQFSSLSVSSTKIPPHCQMLVIHPAFYILRRDPQGRLRSNKPINRNVFCELVGDFISSCPSMSMDPIQPRSVPGRVFPFHNAFGNGRRSYDSEPIAKRVELKCKKRRGLMQREFQVTYFANNNKWRYVYCSCIVKA